MCVAVHTPLMIIIIENRNLNCQKWFIPVGRPVSLEPSSQLTLRVDLATKVTQVKYEDRRPLRKPVETKCETERDAMGDTSEVCSQH